MGGVGLIWDFVFDFIFPKFCVICGREGTFLCRRCRKNLPGALQVCSECTRPSIYGLTHDYCQRKLGLEGLIAIFDYKNEAVKKVVEAIKFGFNRELVGEVLAGWRLPKKLAGAAVVPVPLHFRRENWRGFNQAELIARRMVGRKPLVKGLIRLRATSQQARAMGRGARAENIKGAFGLGSEGRSLAGKKVILVDDVFTSGITMRECAKVLKEVGVKEVWGLVLAR